MSVIQSIKSTKFDILVDFKNPRDNRMIFKKIADISLDENHIGFQLGTQDYNNQSIKSDSLKTQELPSWYRGINFQTMKIVIKDTLNRRAPVVRSLEIWGNISHENDLKTIQRIKELVKVENRVSFYSSSASETSTASSKTDALKQPSESTIKISDEFLDAITNELLVMPFTLPSGNVVDHTTIEKHNRNEEVYGRLPSDPFTGVCYTIDCKPIFNAALKARLDEFKTRQCDNDEVKRSGRTVGKRPNFCDMKPSTSKQSSDNHQEISSKKLKTDDNNLDSLISEMYQNKKVSIFTQPKSQMISSHETRKCNKCQCEPSRLDCNFYRIVKCSHEYCRNCILEIGTICLNCQRSFNSSQIEKMNL